MFRVYPTSCPLVLRDRAHKSVVCGAAALNPRPRTPKLRLNFEPQNPRIYSLNPKTQNPEVRALIAEESPPPPTPPPPRPPQRKKTGAALSPSPADELCQLTTRKKTQKNDAPQRKRQTSSDGECLPELRVVWASGCSIDGSGHVYLKP